MLAKFKSDKILSQIDSVVNSNLFVHTEESESPSDIHITNFNAFDDENNHQVTELK